MSEHRQRGGISFKLVVLLTLAGLIFLAYLLRHPLLRLAGGLWVVDEPLVPSDAIILLGDDNYLAERAARAAELYRGHWAPVVAASGRQLRRSAGISELMQRDLIERGVPTKAIVRFAHTAGDTREEAQALQQLVAEHRWRRVLVVTSNYHTRRTRYIFRRVLPVAVDVCVAAARDTYYDPSHWWESRYGVKIFFTEFTAFGAAMWELRHAALLLPVAWPLGYLSMAHA